MTLASTKCLSRNGIKSLKVRNLLMNVNLLMTVCSILEYIWRHVSTCLKFGLFVTDMSNNIVSQEEQDRFESNRQNLDRYLGAYPYDR